MTEDQQFEQLIKNLNSETKRANLLQAELDKIDEFYFDAMQELYVQIAALKLKNKH